MNEQDAYKYIEERFVATFLDELMPGIFHNFANPLNGIMGRSKLMQRRLAAYIDTIAQNLPDGKRGVDEGGRKLLSDINAIANESDKFYDLFRISTGKFYAIGARHTASLNLSNLIETEMGFADFYLDFKHNVKKDIRIDRDMPDITGIMAFLSMAFWVLIRQSMKIISDRPDQTFKIETDHDDQWAWVVVNHLDGGRLKGWRETRSDKTGKGGEIHQIADDRKELLCALLLLEKSSPGVEIVHDAKAHTLTVKIPHVPARKGAR